MPIMDGFDATQSILKIIKDADDPDYCRIVALTSYTAEETRDRILNLGAKDMINKPLSNKDLQRMVYLHFFRRTELQLMNDLPHLY